MDLSAENDNKHFQFQYATKTISTIIANKTKQAERYTIEAFELWYGS